MVYQTDTSAVKSAQEEIEQLKYEEQIRQIDNAIDGLNDQIDNLKNTMDSQLEAIDLQIDALNDYKDAWQEVANSFKKAQEAMYASMVLGGNWRELIGNMDPNILSSFGDQYYDLSDQIQTYTENAKKAALEALGEMGDSGTEATEKAVDNANQISNAITGGGSSSNGGKGKEKKQSSDSGEDKQNKNKEAGASDSVVGSLNQANEKIQETSETFIEVTPTIVEQIQQWTDGISALITELESAISKAKELASAMSGLGGGGGSSSGVNVGGANKAAYRAKGTVGKAFAKGYPGLEHDELSLTSEYGQPELIVTPDGQWQLTTEPTMQKLKKGTVIFNGNQTNRILKNGGTSGKAFANGTGATITPLSSTDPERFKMYEDISAMLINTDSIQLGIKDITKAIDAMNVNLNSNQLTSVSTPTITFGDISVTCPGVTDADIARNLPNVLENAFSGLALNAYQQSMKR